MALTFEMQTSKRPLLKSVRAPCQMFELPSWRYLRFSTVFFPRVLYARDQLATQRGLRDVAACAWTQTSQRPLHSAGRNPQRAHDSYLSAEVAFLSGDELFRSQNAKFASLNGSYTSPHSQLGLPPSSPR